MSTEGRATEPGRRWHEELWRFVTELAGGLALVPERAGTVSGPSGVIVWAVPGSPLSLIEFPADDPERARRFWTELLGVDLEVRQDGEGEGWQTHSGAPAVGVHARGPGPGDSVSLPYFVVSDVADALKRVEALGGSVVHPGEAWAICKDSEGSPFGLARDSVGG
jgi:predicted enzyme related to lactoylglutathione lyase